MPKGYNKYDLFDIATQIDKWRKVEKELDAWLKKHSTNHPDFENMFRNLNNARIKIEQLNNRKEFCNVKVHETYKLPQKSTTTRF